MRIQVPLGQRYHDRWGPNLYRYELYNSPEIKHYCNHTSQKGATESDGPQRTGSPTTATLEAGSTWVLSSFVGFRVGSMCEVEWG